MNDLGFKPLNEDDEIGFLPIEAEPLSMSAHKPGLTVQPSRRGPTIQAAPEQTWYEKALEPVIGPESFAGRAMERMRFGTGDPRLEAMVKDPRASLASTPLVNLEEFSPEIRPEEEKTALGVGKGVVRGGLGFATGLSSPVNLALMGAGRAASLADKVLSTSALRELAHTIGSLTGKYFGAEMLRGAVEQSPAAFEALKKGDYATAAEHVVGVGTSGWLGQKMLRGHPQVLPPEQAAPVVEPPVREPVPGAGMTGKEAWAPLIEWLAEGQRPIEARRHGVETGAIESPQLGPPDLGLKVKLMNEGLRDKLAQGEVEGMRSATDLITQPRPPSLLDQVRTGMSGMHEAEARGTVEGMRAATERFSQPQGEPPSPVGGLPKLGPVMQRLLDAGHDPATLHDLFQNNSEFQGAINSHNWETASRIAEQHRPAPTPTPVVNPLPPVKIEPGEISGQLPTVQNPRVPLEPNSSPRGLGEKSTEEIYKNPITGAWLPERKQFHEAEVDQVLEGHAPSGKQPVFYNLGGGPAAGKGELRKIALERSPGAVVVDPDYFKSRIPEAEGLRQKAGAESSSLLHEESASMAKRALDRAISQGLDVIFDTSSSSDPKTRSVIIDYVKSKGYKTVGMFVDVPIEEAMARAKKRAETSTEPGNKGRFVNDSFLRQAHQGAARNYPILSQKLDESYLYDNRNRLELVHEKLANGAEKVHNEAAWEEYRRKGASQDERSRHQQDQGLRPGRIQEPEGRGRILRNSPRAGREGEGQQAGGLFGESAQPTQNVADRFQQVGQVVSVPTSEVTTNEKLFQPRGKLSSARVAAIAEKMQARGFDPNRPVDVWPDPETGKLVILSGHHRLAAARQGGVESIAAVIHPEMSLKEAVDFARRSNSTAMALAPTAEARAFALELEEGKTIEQISKAYGQKKTGEIQNRLALNNLTDRLKEHVDDGTFPVEHAQVLGKAVERYKLSAGLQEEIFDKIVKEIQVTPTELKTMIDTLAPKAQEQMTLGLGFTVERGMVDALVEIQKKGRELNTSKRRWGGVIKEVNAKRKKGQVIKPEVLQSFNTAQKEIKSLEAEIGQLEESIGMGKPPSAKQALAGKPAEKAPARVANPRDNLWRRAVQGLEDRYGYTRERAIATIRRKLPGSNVADFDRAMSNWMGEGKPLDKVKEPGVERPYGQETETVPTRVEEGGPSNLRRSEILYQGRTYQHGWQGEETPPLAQVSLDKIGFPWRGIVTSSDVPIDKAKGFHPDSIVEVANRKELASIIEHREMFLPDDARLVFYEANPVPGRPTSDKTYSIREARQFARKEMAQYPMEAREGDQANLPLSGELSVAERRKKYGEGEGQEGFSFEEANPEPKQHQLTAPEKQPWEMTRDEFANKGEKEFPMSEALKSLHEHRGRVKGLDLARERDALKYLSDLEDAVRRRDPVHAQLAEEALQHYYRGDYALATYASEAALGYLHMVERAETAWNYPAELHKRAVEKALSEGKPVPPEVLADYPELKPAETLTVEEFNRQAAAAQEKARGERANEIVGELGMKAGGPKYLGSVEGSPLFGSSQKTLFEKKGKYVERERSGEAGFANLWKSRQPDTSGIAEQPGVKTKRSWMQIWDKQVRAHKDKLVAIKRAVEELEGSRKGQIALSAERDPYKVYRIVFGGSIKGRYEDGRIDFLKIADEARTADLADATTQYLTLKQWTRAYDVVQEHLAQRSKEIPEYKAALKTLDAQVRKIETTKGDFGLRDSEKLVALKERRDKVRRQLSEAVDEFNHLKYEVENSKVVPPDANMEPRNQQRIDSEMAELKVKLTPEQWGKIEQVGQKIFDFNRKVLDIKRREGLITEEEYQTYLKRGDEYIPNFREFDVDVRNEANKGRGMNPQDVDKRLEGGVQPTMDPWEASLAHYYQVVKAAESNRAAQSLVKYLTEQTVRGDALRPKPMGIDEAPEHGRGVIRVYEDGIPKDYSVPVELHNAVNVINPEALGFLGKAVYQAISRFAQMGYTGLHFGFMVRNVPRDVRRMMKLSRVGLPEWYLHPVKFGRLVKEWQGTIKEQIQKSPEFREALRGGLFYGTMQKIIDGPEASPSLRKMSLNPLQKVADLSSLLEQATKLMTYKRARAAGMTPAEAVWEGRNWGGSPDFANTGMDNQLTILLTLFMNARIEGKASDLAAIERDPKRFMRVLLTGAAAQAALQAWNAQFARKDGSKEIDHIADTDSQSYDVFVLPWMITTKGGNRRFATVKVAKSEFEQMVFNPIQQAFRGVFGGKFDAGQVGVDAATQMLPLTGQVDKEHVGRDLGYGVLATTNPIVQAGIEQLANKESHRKIPIIPKSEENRIAQLQFGRTTPWVYRKAGELTGQSPRRLQHIGQKLGGPAEAFTDAVGWLAKWTGADKTPSRGMRLPVVSSIKGAFVGSETDKIDIENTERFYDLAERAQQAAGTLKYYSQSDPGKVASFLKSPENLRLLGFNSALLKTRGDLANLRDQRDGIENSAASEEKKQEMLVSNYEQTKAVIQNILDAYQPKKAPSVKVQAQAR